jgi:pimeloyl-ACP methyl ester carboxylesterase
MEQFARDCAAIIEAYCEPPVILSGLSMGALITQQVAIDFPHLVRLAIPMGTAAKITGFTRDWMEAEIAARRQGLFMTPEFSACHYAAFAYPAQALADGALWDKVKAAYTPRFADRDPEMLIAQWQPCLDFDCSEGLKSCPVPIHAIAFDQDVQTPPSLVKRVADLALHGHYHELEGLGHVSLYRQAGDRVNAYLEQLIREHA